MKQMIPIKYRNYMPHHSFKLKFIGHTVLAPYVHQLSFVRVDALPLPFIPGQFITFLLPHPSGKTIRRSYSLANYPLDNHVIEIAVAPVNEGFATNVLFNLNVGDELCCIGPQGKLRLEAVEGRSHHVLAATSTGVAPYRSMLPTIAKRLAQYPHLQVTLLLGVRYANHLLYGEELIDFANQNQRFYFRAYLSREPMLTQRYQYSGYVQSAFSELNLNPQADLIYLCGNPYMINESMVILQKIGFGLDRIRREKYFPAKIKQADIGK